MNFQVRTAQTFPFQAHGKHLFINSENEFIWIQNSSFTCFVKAMRVHQRFMKKVSSLLPIPPPRVGKNVGKVCHEAPISFRFTELMKKEHIEAKRENYANWEIFDISLFDFFPTYFAIRFKAGKIKSRF